VTDAGSTIDSKSFLNVGNQGSGTLTIEKGGTVLATEGRFGTGAPSGNATVTVDGATSLLDAGSLIRMSIQASLDPTAPHGTSLLTLKNDATVRATNIFVGDSGTIDGTGTLDGNVTLLGGTVAPGLSPGRITMTGDFTLDGGQLVIEIAGLGAGEYDVIEVGGIANLIAGTILFDFTDGFAPQAGDEIDFLLSDDVMLGAGVIYAYEGLASGFQFDVDPTTGGLVFVALTNGVPVGVPEPSALAILAGSLASFCLVRARCMRMRFVAAVSPRLRPTAV
jgi:hypothetical protein